MPHQALNVERMAIGLVPEGLGELASQTRPKRLPTLQRGSRRSRSRLYPPSGPSLPARPDAASGRLGLAEALEFPIRREILHIN